MLSHKKAKGFTLIEVMITVAILGILIAIALPNYRSFVLKGNRSDAMAILNEVMQAQERYAAANDTYVTDISTLGYANPQLSAEGNYRVAAGNCTSGGITVCVRLTATAVGGQANDDNGNSGNLSLNSRGTKQGW
ncbi:MAG: type IV pilin protein [Spongiibacteraceae bacterium]